MEKLLAKVAKLVAAKAEKVAEALLAAAKVELPGDVEVTRDGGDLVIEGKALAKRALSEVALRGLAALAKAIAEMSGAAAALQAALVAALAGDPVIAAAASGVFDGPPARAVLPYLAVGGGQVSDWSVKDARGREHRVAVTVWDDCMASARLHGLMAAAEEAIEDMPRALDGHRVASIVFLRGRIVRDAAGPWAGMIEYRVRTIEAA